MWWHVRLKGSYFSLTSIIPISELFEPLWEMLWKVSSWQRFLSMDSRTKMTEISTMDKSKTKSWPSTFTFIIMKSPSPVQFTLQQRRHHLWSRVNQSALKKKVKHFFCQLITSCFCCFAEETLATFCSILWGHLWPLACLYKLSQGLHCLWNKYKFLGQFSFSLLFI